MKCEYARSSSEALKTSSLALSIIRVSNVKAIKCCMETRSE